MSKTFCCCIPVRAAVFFFSLLSFASAGLVAAIAWFTLHLVLSGQTFNDFDYGSINQKGRIILGVVGGVFTFLACVALGGFFGSIFRARRLVKLYSVFTWIYVIVTIVGAGFFYYFMYSGKNLYNDCHFTDANGAERECRVEFKTWQKIVYTIVITISLLIQIWIASVIGRYVDQLYEEAAWSGEYKLAKPAGASTYQPTYYPPQAQEAHQGLLNPSGNYPYTDSHNAFGTNHSHA